MNSYRYLGELLTKRGVSFWVCEQEAMPWNVQFRGSGHYFRSLQALCGYCAGRGWIRCDQINALEKNLRANADSILIFEPAARNKRNYRRKTI